MFLQPLVTVLFLALFAACNSKTEVVFIPVDPKPLEQELCAGSVMDEDCYLSIVGGMKSFQDSVEFSEAFSDNYLFYALSDSHSISFLNESTERMSQLVNNFRTWRVRDNDRSSVSCRVEDVLPSQAFSTDTFLSRPKYVRNGQGRHFEKMKFSTSAWNGAVSTCGVRMLPDSEVASPFATLKPRFKSYSGGVTFYAANLPELGNTFSTITYTTLADHQRLVTVKTYYKKRGPELLQSSFVIAISNYIGIPKGIDDISKLSDIASRLSREFGNRLGSKIMMDGLGIMDVDKTAYPSSSLDGNWFPARLTLHLNNEDFSFDLSEAHFKPIHFTQSGDTMMFLASTARNAIRTSSTTFYKVDAFSTNEYITANEFGQRTDYEHIHQFLLRARMELTLGQLGQRGILQDYAREQGVDRRVNVSIDYVRLD